MNKEQNAGTDADSSTTAELLPSASLAQNPMLAACGGEEEKLYRFVKVSERQPNKFSMYICHVKVIDEGLAFHPVCYCQFDTIRNEWTNPSVCGTKGEVTEWLELVER